MPTIDHISPLPDLLPTPIYDFALLLRAPRLGWAARAEEALRTLFGKRLEPLPDDAHERSEHFEEVLTEGKTYYVVNGLCFELCGPMGTTRLEHVHEPFPFRAEQFAESTPAPEEQHLPDLRREIERHTACIRITAGSTPEVTVRQSNHIRCLMAAALWDDDVVLLHEMQSGLCYPPTEATWETLASGVLAELESPATQPACDGCVAEVLDLAREEWPDFQAAFDNRTRGDEFYVKHRLGPAGGDELVWSRVVGLRGNKITAKLQTEPMNPQLGTRGAPQRFSAAEVLDWYYDLPEFGECDGWFSDPAEREHCEPIGGRDDPDEDWLDADDAEERIAAALLAAQAERLRRLSELPEPTRRRRERPPPKRKSDGDREQGAGEGDAGG